MCHQIDLCRPLLNYQHPIFNSSYSLRELLKPNQQELSLKQYFSQQQVSLFKSYTDLILSIENSILEKRKTQLLQLGYKNIPLKFVNLGQYNFKFVNLEAIPFSLPSIEELLNPVFIKDTEDKILSKLEEIISTYTLSFSGIIIEPFLTQSFYAWRPEFLAKLEQFCRKHQVLLIFNELSLNIARGGSFLISSNLELHPDLLIFNLDSFYCFVSPNQLSHLTNFDSIYCNTLLNYLTPEKYQEIFEISLFLKKRLELLQLRYRELRNVRHKGYFFAFDILQRSSFLNIKKNLLGMESFSTECYPTICFYPSLDFKKDQINNLILQIENLLKLA